MGGVTTKPYQGYNANMQKDEIKKRLHGAVRTSPSRKKIRKISLFGSYLHGDAKEASDIDLLIELTEESMGLFEFVGLKQFLEEHLGTSVDLVTSEALSKYFREDVEREAELLYET